MWVVAIASVPSSSLWNSAPTRFRLLDFAQRAARGGDHRFAGGRERGEALALPHEDADAELVLELANLFADAGLRREQSLRRVGHVEAVVDDRAKIAQLLQVQGVITSMS